HEFRVIRLQRVGERQLSPPTRVPARSTSSATSALEEYQRALAPARRKRRKFVNAARPEPDTATVPPARTRKTGKNRIGRSTNQECSSIYEGKWIFKWKNIPLYWQNRAEHSNCGHSQNKRVLFRIGHAIHHDCARPCLALQRPARAKPRMGPR